MTKQAEAWERQQAAAWAAYDAKRAEITAAWKLAIAAYERDLATLESLWPDGKEERL